MHPPFFIPDVHVSDHPITHRRSKPERLDLRLPTSGWPPLPVLPVTQKRRPVPKPEPKKPQLVVVPPPQPRLRDLIGRFLIRTGQRIILN